MCFKDLIKHMGLLLASGLLLWLSGCTTREEIAEYIVGTWAGSDENVKWCITYFDDQDKTAELHLAAYNAGSESLELTSRKHLTGYWETGRGMRFRQEMEHDHDLAGNLITKNKRSGILQEYIILDQSENQFTYLLEGTENKRLVYTNHRADNCLEFQQGFDAQLEKVRQRENIVQ